jgi:hypothetical protein
MPTSLFSPNATVHPFTFWNCEDDSDGNVMDHVQITTEPAAHADGFTFVRLENTITGEIMEIVLPDYAVDRVARMIHLALFWS